MSEDSLYRKINHGDTEYTELRLGNADERITVLLPKKLSSPSYSGQNVSWVNNFCLTLNSLLRALRTLTGIMSPW